MTNEEISKWLINLKDDIGNIRYQSLWHYAEALDMAIEALQQQGNLLDRNDLYDSFKHDDDGSEWSMGEILSRIQNFPSAKETEDFWSEQYQDIDDYPDTDGDYISRQAAIDAVYKSSGTGTALKALKALPSAQPEIIRCKDCKHHDGIRCFRWNSTIMTEFDDYCSNGERRSEDE